MENASDKYKFLKLIGIIGLGTLAIGSLYYIYKTYFHDKHSEFITDSINLSLQEIKAQIEEANGNFDENLKKIIFLKVNQTHERVMKMRFDAFIEKNNLSSTNNILTDENLQEFLQVNWETYKSTTDYILTKIGISEKEYVELFQNMSLSEFMEYEYMIEKDTIFQGKQILNKLEAKAAFLDYQRISESYINNLNNKVNKDNKNSNFDQELEMGVLYSNIRIETRVYLKYHFTPKEILYMVKKYNLLDDPEVKKAYDTMMKNSPKFHKV